MTNGAQISPSSSRPGCGIGDHAVLLATALERRGHAQTIVTDVSAPQVSSGGSPRRLAFFRRHSVREFVALRRTLRKLDVRVVHLHFQTLLYSEGAAVFLAPLILRKRLVVAVTAHDLMKPYFFRGAGPLRTLLMRTFLKHSSIVFVSSDQLLDQALRAGAPLGRVFQLPIPSNIRRSPLTAGDAARLREEFGLPEDLRRIFICFGAIRASAPLELLLRAFALLPEAERRMVRCLVVGGPPRYAADGHDDPEFVRGLVQAAGIGETVTVTGFLPDATVSHLLQLCDAVILPRPQGAAPASTAMSAAIEHRRPVIANGSPLLAPTSMPSSAIEWFSGEHELCDVIRRMVRERPGALPEQVTSALERAAERISWDAVAETVDLHYADMLRTLPSVGATR